MAIISDKRIIEALTEMNGCVYLAAKRAGCSPQTIYNKIQKNPAVAAAIEDARGELIDFAEQKLKQAVLNGEPWAVAMVLKTIGKDRGYVEREKDDIEAAGVLKVIVERV